MKKMRRRRRRRWRRRGRRRRRVIAWKREKRRKGRRGRERDVCALSPQEAEDWAEASWRTSKDFGAGESRAT